MRSGSVKLLLLFAALLEPLYCAENWIRLDTPHFEMYTTNGEKQATTELQVFEQVRSFFLERSASKTAPETAIRVIAFRSEKEYRPYRLNEGAFAYYTRSQKVDYIVMQDLNSANHRAAVHEYTHLIVEHLKLKLPTWLNEGMADVYSTLQSEGKQTLVGTPIPEDVMLLRSQPWLDLNTLFSVDHDSPYYNQREKMQIFYAESWALTHMLSLGKGYVGSFPRFLALVAAGHPIAECFETAYGKNLAQVDKELHSYMQQSTVQISVFDSKLERPALEPNVLPVSDLNLNLVLADLLACHPKHTTEAMDRLTKLAAENPTSPDVQESLGYLLWREGDLPKAREHFESAIDKGSKNSEMMYQYSQLLLASGGSKEEAIAVLTKATTIKPGYDEALYALGMTEMQIQKWSDALAAFSQIKTVTPERAYSLFSSISFASWKVGSLDKARSFAEKARQFAKTPEETTRMTQFQEMLNRPAATAREAASVTTENTSDAPDRPTLRHRTLARDEPTIQKPNLQHVEAVAKFFNCDPKAPSLRVSVGSKEMTFILSDPSDIIVRNSPNGTVDFNCGVQKATKVGIFYTPATPGVKADGSIVELVF